MAALIQVGPESGVVDFRLVTAIEGELFEEDQIADAQCRGMSADFTFLGVVS